MTEFHVPLNVIIKERKPSWCRKKATRIHSSSSVWSLGILKEERRSILDARRRLEQHSDGTWRVWESKNGRENGTQETKTREMDERERANTNVITHALILYPPPTIIFLIQSPIENIEKRQNNSPWWHVPTNTSQCLKTNNLPSSLWWQHKFIVSKSTNERTNVLYPQ